MGHYSVQAIHLYVMLIWFVFICVFTFILSAKTYRKYHQSNISLHDDQILYFNIDFY